MKNVHLKSFAKVNLFLKVGKIYRNTNLHNVQSLIFLIDLHDQIILKKNKKKDKIKFTGQFKKNIAKSNSIKKTLSLLRKKGFIDKKKKFDINIKKNIPVFSGFGGGSSNAASIIKYFFKKKEISQTYINYFSKYLGSDLRVFLKSKKVFQKNLFSIKEYKNNHNFYFVLVYPFLKSSSKNAYKNFRKNNYTKINSKNNFSFNSKHKLLNKLKSNGNSLQNIVISKFPTISNILRELELMENCQFSRMTGSGSACFGVFLNKNHGVKALKEIKKSFPNFWCVLSRTI